MNQLRAKFRGLDLCVKPLPSNDAGGFICSLYAQSPNPFVRHHLQFCVSSSGLSWKWFFKHSTVHAEAYCPWRCYFPQITAKSGRGSMKQNMVFSATELTLKVLWGAFLKTRCCSSSLFFSPMWAAAFQQVALHKALTWRKCWEVICRKFLQGSLSGIMCGWIYEPNQKSSISHTEKTAKLNCF